MYRALLIDDEWLTIVSTRYSLNLPNWGFHEVCECTDPYQALALVREQRFDVAFVDIRMPGLSGLQLIEQAGQTDVHFVMLTGYSDFAYAQQALRLQVLDYCLKPLQEEDVDALRLKMIPRLKARRLTTDPDLYQQLLHTEEPAALLHKLGLVPDADRPHLIIAAVCADSEDDLMRDLPLNGSQCALRLSEHVCVRVMAAKVPVPNDLLARSDAASLPLGVAYCALGGHELRRLKVLLPHAVTLAQHLRDQSAEHGRAMETCFAAAETQDLNGSFLNLLGEVGERFMEDLSLSELAERYHLNYSYCSTLFSQRTGLPFSKYVNQLRLQKARALLACGEHTISDVSRLVGYNNYNHFTATFKKVYHMTPSQYVESLGAGDRA